LQKSLAIAKNACFVPGGSVEQCGGMKCVVAPPNYSDAQDLSRANESNLNHSVAYVGLRSAGTPHERLKEQQ